MEFIMFRKSPDNYEGIWKCQARVWIKAIVMVTYVKCLLIYTHNESELFTLDVILAQSGSIEASSIQYKTNRFDDRNIRLGSANTLSIAKHKAWCYH